MAKLRIGRSPAAAEAACEHFQPKQFSERDWRLVLLSKQLGIGLPRGIAKKAGVSSTTLIDSLAYDLPTILDLVSGQQIQRGTGRNDGIEVDHHSVLLERAVRQLKLMSHDENATLTTVMFTCCLRHRIDCAERHSTLIALTLIGSHVAAPGVLFVGTRLTALIGLLDRHYYLRRAESHPNCL
jgi:hypothetical protein